MKKLSSDCTSVFKCLSLDGHMKTSRNNNNNKKTFIGYSKIQFKVVDYNWWILPIGGGLLGKIRFQWAFMATL